MANPQKENGYTPIANEILEQIAKLPLNGTQFRIIMVVWRYTYGFSRKSHDLSLIFISNATGIRKQQIKREFDELISMNIISIVKEATFKSTRVIAFNKDYSTWNVDCTPISIQYPKKSTGTVPELEYSPVPELEYSPVPELEYSPVPELEYQENNIKTKNKEKSIDDFFESIWVLYPEKKGKGQVKHSQKEKLYKVGFDELSRCIERYRKSKQDWKAWQHGSTFFNSGYIDYLDKNYSEQEAPKDHYRRVD